MTTDPLVRRFNPTGPNYGPSGLDTPGRDAERREALSDHVPSDAKFQGLWLNYNAEQVKSFLATNGNQRWEWPISLLNYRGVCAPSIHSSQT